MFAFHSSFHILSTFFVSLTQQTGRYLLKCYSTVLTGNKINGTASYLNDFSPQKIQVCKANTVEQFSELSNLLQLFAERSAFLVWETGRSFGEKKGEGVGLPENWNYHLSDFIKLNEAHATYVTLRSFISDLESLGRDSPLRQVLTPLCKLYALVNIEEKLGEFLLSGVLSTIHTHFLSKSIKLLLQQIRPEAISLVDSFDFSDFFLNSSLGRYDGRVYEDLFERTKQCPLNLNEVSEAYNLHLSKLIKGNRVDSKL